MFNIFFDVLKRFVPPPPPLKVEARSRTHRCAVVEGEHACVLDVGDGAAARVKVARDVTVSFARPHSRVTLDLKVRRGRADWLTDRR